MRRFSSLIMMLPGLFFSASLVADEASTNLSEYRSWIVEMESLERGPFARLRWFCNDGTVFPPKSYACREHGGGYQHGEWSEKTRALREQGYLVANVLAGLDAGAMVDDPGFRNLYAQILIERFLISADDGWIMRRALFYRGAIQEEDERAAARELLLEMVSRELWVGPGFPALRAGVRTLPHGANSASIQKVRQVSASLSDQDAGFKSIRAKIHGSPGAEDAETVREYAAGLEDEAQRQPYLELATEIDGICQAEPLEIDQLIDFAKHLPDKFPPITDDEGNPAPADVEFGFLDGDLSLFQLRPFLDSKMAQGIGYLHQMEARLKNTSLIEVNMNEVPGI